MKALAYVNDEKYVALADVAGDFESEESGEIMLLRSSPRGAFHGRFSTVHRVQRRCLRPSTRIPATACI
jgi:hypothetical protein